jgi:hypothetical protein
MRAAARSQARRCGTQRCAQHRAAASNRKQPGAAARSEALLRDSERQEAPLSHASRFSSESKGQLCCGCIVAALAGRYCAIVFIYLPRDARVDRALLLMLSLR